MGWSWGRGSFRVGNCVLGCEHISLRVCFSQSQGPRKGTGSSLQEWWVLLEWHVLLLLPQRNNIYFPLFCNTPLMHVASWWHPALWLRSQELQDVEVKQCQSLVGEIRSQHALARLQSLGILLNPVIPDEAKCPLGKVIHLFLAGGKWVPGHQNINPTGQLMWSVWLRSCLFPHAREVAGMALTKAKCGECMCWLCPWPWPSPPSLWQLRASHKGCTFWHHWRV